MPTPERTSGWSRRAFEPPQNRSPFRRAHLDSRALDRVDASRIPSPSNASTARRRRNYSQTGTLRGAFEAISRYPTMSENEDLSTDPYALGTPNRRRPSFNNHASPESNPPNELAETYRQIDDAGSLIDFDAAEDEDVYIPRTQFRGTRSRGSSLGSSMRDHGLFTHTDTNYLEEAPDKSYRRTSRDAVRDEKRLRRATSSRSPVLNRTGTANALTSENLQRREEEEEEEEAHVPEEEDGFKPALNLPLNWGSRGTHRRDWLKDITRRKEPESKEAVEEPSVSSPPKFKLDVTSRNSQVENTHNTNQATADERSVGRYSRAPLADAQNRLSSEQRTEKLAGGDQIPNTPIMVYKNSTFTKRSPTKRDSHDLLRKLSRTESPNQSQNLGDLRTPEGPKMPENRIYDKTPVVTGAWIDTPMTERANRLPEHLSKDIVPSPAKKDQPTNATQPESQAAAKPDTFNIQSRKEQERETELRKEREKRKEERERTENERKEREKKAAEMKSNEGKKPEQGKDEMKGNKPKNTQKPALIKPDLPKSALETVMQDFKADKDCLDVGDDTIESLQLILDEQPSGMKTEAEEDAAYEKSVMEKLELAGSKGRDADVDGFNEKLRALSENINRVSQGLDGLGKQVDSIPTSKKDVKSICNLTSDGCEACSNHHKYMSSVIPLPLLWKRDAVTRRVRPTRLAWFIILLFAWSYAESTMCNYYCHPLAADACEDNCLLRDAPEYPFVLPTMLWRWSNLSGVLAPVWALVLALTRLAGQLLGFWDGYVDEPPHLYNSSGEVHIRGSQTRDFAVTATPTRGLFGFANLKPQRGTHHSNIPEPVPELDLNSNLAGAGNEDGSMDDDEYI